ncbi:hypothetical protein OF83DRAFT_1081538 [Amylostereum chailletii]|nr:hypothetical protein OF83DRAFT_1081538 [Amylostereum chailletii]
MADKAYEVAYWPASDAVLEDPSLVDPALDILRTKTPYPLFTGIQTEAPNFWVVIVWETVNAHKEFMASPEYPGLVEALAPTFKTKEVTLVHAHFTADPLGAFGAQATEHAWITAKAGVGADVVVAVIERILSVVREERQAVSSGGAWGRVVEKSEEILLVIGWTSVEAHVGFVSGGGPGEALVNELREIADIRMSHAKLKRSPK